MDNHHTIITASEAAQTGTQSHTAYNLCMPLQVLLQLNIAFYLPSIPVLIISGQLEKALQARFGPTGSMMLRLNFGLGGCLACCAAFPFLPQVSVSFDGAFWQCPCLWVKTITNVHCEQRKHSLMLVAFCVNQHSCNNLQQMHQTGFDLITP